MPACRMMRASLPAAPNALPCDRQVVRINAHQGAMRRPTYMPTMWAVLLDRARGRAYSLLMTDTDTPITSYYCIECFRGNLPIGMVCTRLPIDEYRATCLRCCNHNHG